MRYLSQPVQFVSCTATVSGDKGQYTNYQIHVKDDGGYLSRLDATEKAYSICQALSMSDTIVLSVLSFTKKYRRRDGSGDVYVHRELITDVISSNSSSVVADVQAYFDSIGD